MGTGIRVTEEQKGVIVGLRAQGKSTREIEQATGLGKSTVARYIAKWGKQDRAAARLAKKEAGKPNGNNAARAGSLYLDHDLQQVMDRIAEQYKLAHRGAVVRRAVALLDTVLEYRSRGYRFYLRDCPENERELKIAD